MSRLISRARALAPATGLAAILVAAAGVLAAGAAVGSTGSSAGLSVGARVARYANLRVLAAPATLRVTQQDVANGYVDVGDVSIQMKSNTRNGLLLVFSSSHPRIRHFTVGGLGAEVNVGSSVTLHAMPSLGPGMRTVTKSLAFRLTLPPDLAPGEYDWPIQMNAFPK